jgi:hypothetical protein
MLNLWEVNGTRAEPGWGKGEPRYFDSVLEMARYILTNHEVEKWIVLDTESVKHFSDRDTVIGVLAGLLGCGWGYLILPLNYPGQSVIWIERV